MNNLLTRLNKLESMLQAKMNEKNTNLNSVTIDAKAPVPYEEIYQFQNKNGYERNIYVIPAFGGKENIIIY